MKEVLRVEYIDTSNRKYARTRPVTGYIPTKEEAIEHFSRIKTDIVLRGHSCTMQPIVDRCIIFPAEGSFTVYNMKMEQAWRELVRLTSKLNKARKNENSKLGNTPT